MHTSFVAITAVILCKDQDSALVRALKSVLWCDERILLCDGANEKVSNTAKKFQATYIVHRLNDDFSAQRNYGLSLVQHTWVLFLDADEYVPKETVLELRQAVQEKNADGFLLQRKDLFMGRKLEFGETGFLYLLRLAKKTAGSWERPVHEIWNIHGTVKKIQSPILHTPHRSTSEFLTKINRYTELESQHRRNLGETCSFISLFFYPFAKFVSNFFLKVGFLDGFPGLVMAYMMSLHSLIIRVKLYEKK